MKLMKDLKGMYIVHEWASINLRIINNYRYNSEDSAQIKNVTAYHDVNIACDAKMAIFTACDFYFNPIFPARGETDRSSCAPSSGPHLLLESIVESNIVIRSSPDRCVDHVWLCFCTERLINSSINYSSIGVLCLLAYCIVFIVVKWNLLKQRWEVVFGSRLHVKFCILITLIDLLLVSKQTIWSKHRFCRSILQKSQ